jgi:hypothetical protein
MVNFSHCRGGCCCDLLCGYFGFHTVQAKATFNFSATTIGSVAAYANDRGAEQLAGASLKEEELGNLFTFWS